MAKEQITIPNTVTISGTPAVTLSGASNSVNATVLNATGVINSGNPLNVTTSSNIVRIGNGAGTAYNSTTNPLPVDMLVKTEMRAEKYNGTFSANTGVAVLSPSLVTKKLKIYSIKFSLINGPTSAPTCDFHGVKNSATINLYSFRIAGSAGTVERDIDYNYGVILDAGVGLTFISTIAITSVVCITVVYEEV